MPGDRSMPMNLVGHCGEVAGRQAWCRNRDRWRRRKERRPAVAARTRLSTRLQQHLRAAIVRDRSTSEAIELRGVLIEQRRRHSPAACSESSSHRAASAAGLAPCRVGIGIAWHGDTPRWHHCACRRACSRHSRARTTPTAKPGASSHRLRQQVGRRGQIALQPQIAPEVETAVGDHIAG